MDLLYVAMEVILALRVVFGLQKNHFAQYSIDVLADCVAIKKMDVKKVMHVQLIELVFSFHFFFGILCCC